MGKIWKRKFLFWGDFRFLLGKKVYFPFISQHWEYFVNVSPSYSQSWEQYGNISEVIPNRVNYGGTFPTRYTLPQVIPKIVNAMETFTQIIPRIVINMETFTQGISRIVNLIAALARVERCIEDIRKWMLNDKLKLNDDKPEFMIIGTLQQLAKVSINSLRVGTATITPVSSARNLGSWFDSKLTIATHISKTCNSAFYYLYNLSRIGKYLSKDNTKTLIQAFISSRVNYCNSLLYGLQEYQLNKLQRVQNMCARLICNESKYFLHYSLISRLTLAACKVQN